MKLTLIGPEGFKAVIGKYGQYYITRKNLVTLLSDTEVSPTVANSRAILAAGHQSINISHLRMDIGDQVTLIDLQSKYGSFLDGKQFEQTELAEAGTYQLQLGHVMFKVIYEK